MVCMPQRLPALALVGEERRAAQSTAGRGLQHPCEPLPLFGDGGLDRSLRSSRSGPFLSPGLAPRWHLFRQQTFFRRFYSFGGTVGFGLQRAPLRIVGERERSRPFLLITPAPPKRCRTPIWIGVVPSSAPAVVSTTFVRNAITPLPIAPLVAPLGPVVATSTTVTHQLDRRRRAKLDRGWLGRERGRLRRCRQG